MPKSQARKDERLILATLRRLGPMRGRALAREAKVPGPHLGPVLDYLRRENRIRPTDPRRLSFGRCQLEALEWTLTDTELTR